MLPLYPSTRSGKGSTIVNVTLPVVPPGVVTVKACGPRGVEAGISKLAPIDPPEVVKIEIVTPGIGEMVVLPGIKLVPRSVKELSLPRTATTGLIDVRVGTPGNTTNVRLLLGPLAVETETPPGPVVVFAGIVMTAVAEVESMTTIWLKVPTPLMVNPGTKLVPVKVTLNVDC